MKKNTMMRLASFLLIAVLISTSAISGTYAKYVTTGSANDSARVAKWGVTVAATGDEAFAEKYNDAANAAGTKVVSNVTGEDVLAPGTNGSLGSITITGTPEVMVNVSVTATLTLTGWNIPGDANNDQKIDDGEVVEYCPIVFTIGGATYGMIDGVTNKSTDIADLQSDIVAALAENTTSIPANTNLASTYDFDIDWAWSYDGEDDKDTALGNLATAPTISFTCSATVTQVD